MKSVDTASIDLILSDIPYGICYDKWCVIHDNKNSALLGQSEAQIRAGNIFKTRGKPLNDWCDLWVKDW